MGQETTNDQQHNGNTYTPQGRRTPQEYGQRQMYNQGGYDNGYAGYNKT